MAKDLSQRTNIEPVSPKFPSGAILDDTSPGSNDGTPINRDIAGDAHQFFAKLMRSAGITPTDIEDSEEDGFQLIEAFINQVSRSKTMHFHKLIGATGFSAALHSSASSPTTMVVGGLNGIIEYSSNGFSYLPISGAGDFTIVINIVYDDSVFVAIGTGGTDKIITSTNGTNWVIRASTAINPSGISFGNDIWVLVCTAGARNFTSTDLITWVGATPANSKDQDIAFGNDKFVAVGINTGGSGASYSTDGLSWILCSGIPDECNKITFGNGFFLALTDTSSDKFYYRSSDGVTFTKEIDLGVNKTGIVFKGGLFFMLFTSEGDDLYSAYGKEWSRVSQSSNGNSSTYEVFNKRRFMFVRNSLDVMTDF